MYKKILVPVDGSDLSKQAIQKAVALAKALHSELYFLHVKHMENLFYHGMVGVIFDPNAKKIYEEKIDDLCRSFLEEATTLAQSHHVKSKQLLVENSEPYQAIIEYATLEKCDLIFMASHGYNEIEGLLLGSQTNKVLVHSLIPVLVSK
ncbi:universal stress protein [Sulfurospirillum halorespirans]|uniref:Universal stress protein n=1 Tax=Sulfurospirillum halorespirans DSM 13726 TaxID=1193502 RepID=A0A1D7THE8_9BACT|nr:universal stress protein [Sulfurospirillum halorespirans]AOO64403.1 universal stress protein [Sulfurospirillum halorespirans DSM 13726]